MTTLAPQTEDRALMRGARFAFILPLAFITYSLAYLDRLNIGFGETGSMSETLKISKSQFAFFNASFFIGYVLFQIPGAAYAARKSVKKLMFWALIFWGIIASLTAFLHNFTLLVIDRFLLGAVEGVVFPALLVLLTHWFTKRERSRANTILILGNPLTMLWGSVVSSTLIGYFDAPQHRLFGFHGWQLMLLFEGAPTLLWAVIWWVLVRDRPADARWLPADQAATLQATLDAEQRDVKQVRDYWAAFRDPQVILLCAQFLTWSIGIYGLNMWLPVILKDRAHLEGVSLGLANALPYLFGTIVMITVSTISDRRLVRKAFVWPFLIIGAGAFLMSYAGSPDPSILNNKAIAHPFPWVAYIGLAVAATCMYAPYGPFWAMIPEMVSRNVIGESLALINTAGAVGGFIGTFGVGRLKEITGGYGASFACLSTCLAASGVLTLLIRVRQRRLHPSP